MIFKDANGNVTNHYNMSDATIKMTQPLDPEDIIRVRWKPTVVDISNVKWYSHETGEGWISDVTIDTDFFGDDLNYTILDEFRNSYGSLFQYIKKR